MALHATERVVGQGATDAIARPFGDIAVGVVREARTTGADGAEQAVAAAMHQSIGGLARFAGAGAVAGGVVGKAHGVGRGQAIGGVVGVGLRVRRSDAVGNAGDLVGGVVRV